MQTFLPYPDFERSARALDTKRLGKQRVECLQVVRALTTPGYGWAAHPAVLMWKGHEEALGRYGLVCCERWTGLGFADTCAATIAADLRQAEVTAVRSQAELADVGELPPWLGDEALHRSHQSSLVRKDPEYYGALFPGVPDDLPYVWPVRSANVVAAEQRKARNAVLRAERAAEQTRRRRSDAAKRAWVNRRLLQEDPMIRETPPGETRAMTDDDTTTGPRAGDLSNDDLLRELESLHSTRHTTLRHGSDDALSAHTSRQTTLEQEYLRRFPQRELDPNRLRDGAQHRD